VTRHERFRGLPHASESPSRRILQSPHGHTWRWRFSDAASIVLRHAAHAVRFRHAHCAATATAAFKCDPAMCGSSLLRERRDEKDTPLKGHPKGGATYRRLSLHTCSIVAARPLLSCVMSRRSSRTVSRPRRSSSVRSRMLSRSRSALRFARAGETDRGRAFFSHAICACRRDAGDRGGGGDAACARGEHLRSESE
jgi:hypothetical protein